MGILLEQIKVPVMKKWPNKMVCILVEFHCIKKTYLSLIIWNENCIIFIQALLFFLLYLLT